MLMLASPRRDAKRAISPGRCGSLAWTISASAYVSCSLSSTVLTVVGLSTMNRVTLFPRLGRIEARECSLRDRAPSLRGNRSRLPCWGAPLIELDSSDLRDTRQREKKGTSSGANQCAACYAKLRLRR